MKRFLTVQLAKRDKKLEVFLESTKKELAAFFNSSVPEPLIFLLKSRLELDLVWGQKTEKWVVECHALARIVKRSLRRGRNVAHDAGNRRDAKHHRRRVESGYLEDSLSTSPGGDVTLGSIMYAALLYRERGSADSFASFDAMGTMPVPSALGRILQLLGVGRPQVA